MGEKWQELIDVMEDRSCSNARLSELTGIAESNISHFIAGGRKPNTDNLVKIADALLCTTDELLGLKTLKRVDATYNPEYDLDFLQNTHEQDVSKTIGRIRAYIERLKRFGQ